MGAAARRTAPQPGQAHDPLLTGLLAWLAEVADGDDKPPSLLCQTIATAIALRLARIEKRPAARPACTSGLAPWQVNKVTNFMLANLEKDLSLVQLAALVSLSPQHFCRAFRQASGLPPHAWLVRQRMEKAKQLLMNHHFGLTEIAFSVGYESQSAFGAAFRRIVGSTPTQWRNARSRLAPLT